MSEMTVKKIIAVFIGWLSEEDYYLYLIEFNTWKKRKKNCHFQKPHRT